jgi:GTP pyrophosphokinase
MPKTTAHIISTDIYTYSDILVHDIVHIVAGYMHAPETDIYDRIWSTYIFARDAHTGQIRKSGEPYITHPLEAVKLLLILKPDIISIQACILHDVIEDTPVSVDDIRERFGPEVADICE